MSEDVFKLDIRTHPYAARPSVEASGIDIYTTYRNVRLELKMASPEKLSWSGLVLIV